MLAGAASQNRSACRTSSTCACSAGVSARSCGRGAGRSGRGGAGDRRWWRYQLERGHPSARHAPVVPTIGDSLVMATSTAMLSSWSDWSGRWGRSARWLRVGAAGREPGTHRGEFPLDLQHLGLPSQLVTQASVLAICWSWSSLALHSPIPVRQASHERLTLR